MEIQKNFTPEQQERFNKYWNMHVVNNYLHSNMPEDFAIEQFRIILAIENEKDFLKRSCEAGLLKAEFI